MGTTRKYSIENAKQLTGLQKVAVLILSLGRELGGRILRELDLDNVEEVTRAVASMGSVAPGVKFEVVEEFYHLVMAKSWADVGGVDFADKLLRVCAGSHS